MRKLNIEITKAKIESYVVTMGDEYPSVMVSIGLYTEGGQKITDYNISNNHWEKDKSFDLPVTALKPIIDVAAELERVVVKHCRDAQKQLAAPKTDADNINLSEIPF